MKNIVRFFLLLLLPATSTLSAQTCIVSDPCPADNVEVCDFTTNDEALWYESYWLDVVTGLHDLPDAPAELGFTATDTCANGSIAIRYVLFLDLDGDGTQETAVGSDSLPGYNIVKYGNVFGAGTARAFDERPVASDLKYGFALETLVSGPGTTARIRWNTAAQPGVYTDPQLPYGMHTVKWFVTDAQGNEYICEYDITVKDCEPPTIVCVSNFIVNIMATGQIALWAPDFLQYAQDNHSPSYQLDFAVRKAGAGNGFPVDTSGAPLLNVVFNCNELGPQLIELWARDQAGNVNYCQPTITIMDPFDMCNLYHADAVMCTRLWCNDGVIANLDYGFGPPDAFDPATGCATFEDLITLTGGYFFLPVYDQGPLNGVNTLDLIRTARHILGLEPLASPYAMIAADVNKGNSITTFDLVESKKLIQGIYDELPNNTSWRFIDANYVFPNPANPFQTAGPDTLTYTLEDSVLYFNFYGIKVGDVDCSAYPGFGAGIVDDRTASLQLSDAILLAGETLELPIRPGETGEWLGFQAGLRFNPDLLEIERVTPGSLPGMDASAFASPLPGTLNVVWFNTAPQVIQPETPLFTLHLKALAPVRLSDALSLAKSPISAEAYTGAETTRKLNLEFTERIGKAGETAIFAPQPNPTAAGATIPLRLAKAETVTLELSDLSGKRVWFNQTTLGEGSHLLEIPAPALRQKGVYVWRLQAGELSANGKLIRL